MFVKLSANRPSGFRNGPDNDPLAGQQVIGFEQLVLKMLPKGRQPDDLRLMLHKAFVFKNRTGFPLAFYK